MSKVPLYLLVLLLEARDALALGGVRGPRRLLVVAAAVMRVPAPRAASETFARDKTLMAPARFACIQKFHELASRPVPE